MGSMSRHTDAILRHFTVELRRRQLLQDQHAVTAKRVKIAISNLNKVFSDSRFVALLDAEGIHTVPESLAKLLKVKR